MAAGTVGDDLVLVVALGAANAGLATVGYTLKNGDGTTLQARTVSGVSEIGDGWYTVTVAGAVWTAVGAFRADWDIATAYKASEDIFIAVDAAADTPGTTTLLARLTATRAGLLDNLDAAISSLPSAAAIAAAVWAAGGRTLSSVSAIVAGVWDELLAGHTTAGSAGKDLASAGVAGDPWGVDISSGYTGNEAGAVLEAVNAKTALITTGTSITLVAPVLASGKVALVQGDDYLAADGRALQWSSSSWPVLTSATVVLHLENYADETATLTGGVVSASEAQVELTAVQTAALDPVSWRYALKATLTDGSVVTLATGELAVAVRP
jgi:hypothetical protein